MSRPASPFAAPVIRHERKLKRDTDEERAEKQHVRDRDRGCVAARSAIAYGFPQPEHGCQGPLEVDHVRASGGLAMKSPTVRTNMVTLCSWHHRLKTEYGKTWRPILLAYLADVEPAA